MTQGLITACADNIEATIIDNRAGKYSNKGFAFLIHGFQPATRELALIFKKTPSNTRIVVSLPAEFAIATIPFKIVERIGKLAYKLDLPAYFKIYSVISVAHLELKPEGEGAYDRPEATNPDSIHVEGDTDEWKSHEVEKILRRPSIRKERKCEPPHPVERIRCALDEWIPE